MNNVVTNRVVVSVAILSLLSVLLIFPQPCFSELLAYEGFDYTGTNLVSANGGMGWSNSWKGGYFATEDCNVSLGGETYAGLSAGPYLKKGKHVYDTKTNVTYMVRSFTNSISTTNQHDIYMSFLYDRGTNGLGEPWSSVSLCTELKGTKTSFGLGGAHVIDKLQLEIAGKRNTWSDVIKGTNAAFYVAKIEFNADNEIDYAFANVYWESDKIPDNEPVSWNHSTTNATNAISDPEFVGIYIKIYKSASPFVFDEFRIGTTWEDVAVAPPKGLLMMVK